MLSNLRGDKKIKKTVDTAKICGILFSVMTDMISCEEVYEASAQERAELNLWYDELEMAAIDAAEAAADRAEYQRQGALDRDGKPIHL